MAHSSTDRHVLKCRCEQASVSGVGRGGFDFQDLGSHYVPGYERVLVHPRHEIGPRRVVRQDAAAEAGLQIAVLDPIGAGLTPGPELYFELMQQNAAALVGCLGAD